MYLELKADAKAELR